MNYLDLFHGIGGFALGAYWAGMKFENHYCSDIEPYAQELYKKRFPDSIQLGDITKINTADLPQGDWIISGGFPCQDISIAGKGAGIHGTRSGLWFEYWRIINDLRPRFAIMENVGMLIHRGLREVLGSLAKIGYNAEWQDIRASDMGAPHKRERIWIVAYPVQNRYSSKIGRINGETICIPEENREKRSQCGMFVRANKLESGREAGDIYQSADVAYPRLQRPQEHEEQTTGIEQCGEAGNVADTGRKHGKQGNSTEMETGQRIRAHGKLYDQSGGEGHGGNYWSTEPAVGRRFDGLSTWLDKNKHLIYFSHNCIMAYVINNYGGKDGKANKEDYGKILRSLRDAYEQEKNQWSFRGLWNFSAKKILLSLMCELEKKSKMQEHLQFESKEIFERKMRELRMEFVITGTSHRSGLHEQLSREYTDSVQALSRFLAHYCEKAWISHCGDYAKSIGWEYGIKRLCDKLPGRVDRLKGLGNAIVPQIAEIIFRQIKDL